jgi:hypothetical protein
MRSCEKGFLGAPKAHEMIVYATCGTFNDSEGEATEDGETTGRELAVNTGQQFDQTPERRYC